MARSPGRSRGPRCTTVTSRRCRDQATRSPSRSRRRRRRGSRGLAGTRVGTGRPWLVHGRASRKPGTTVRERGVGIWCNNDDGVTRARSRCRPPLRVQPRGRSPSRAVAADQRDPLEASQAACRRRSSALANASQRGQHRARGVVPTPVSRAPRDGARRGECLPGRAAPCLAAAGPVRAPPPTSSDRRSPPREAADRPRATRRSRRAARPEPPRRLRSRSRGPPFRAAHRPRATVSGAAAVATGFGPGVS